MKLATLLALVALVAACGSKQIPPGTPPPEYEKPVVPPWPEGSSEPAQPVENEPPRGDTPLPSSASDAGVEAASDGGAVDAAGAPLSDAGVTR